MPHDLVLAGGRVVDPETSLDSVCDVGIDGDSVTALGDRLDGASTVDVGGLVVAPGFVDAIVASDGMPPLWRDTARLDVTAWPLPPQAVTHPRTSGTFGRALRLARQEGTPLMEAVRRATLLPARVLEGSVPAMRRKGRLQAGADADLVVFDEASVTDQATYEASTRPSSGIAHVTVGGTFVVRDGELVPDALPGRALRASPPADPAPSGQAVMPRRSQRPATSSKIDVGTV